MATINLSDDPLIKALITAVNSLLDAENERRKSADQMPQIVINVPEQPAPVINYTPPEITVNVPKQDAPNITVQPAPVTIQKPQSKPSNFVVQRNRDGMITGIEEK